MVNVKELTQADIDAWNAEKKEKKEPTEEEEQAAAGFKKTIQPRVMTPEQARKENPQRVYRTSEQAKEDEEVMEQAEDSTDVLNKWPEHQNISLKREPHKSFWEEGVYEAEIERTWQAMGVDTFHKDPQTGEPMQAVFLHIGFITPDGLRIQKRMTMSRHERSNLTALLSALYGDPAPDDIDSDALVGMRLKIVVKNITNSKGDEWPTITEYIKSTKQFKQAGG
jgi:tRNA G10  N-methylase Trm11